MVTQTNRTKWPRSQRLSSTIVCTLVAVTLILSLSAEALAEPDLAVFGSWIRGGALVVANPDADPSYAVSLWARRWCVDPPFGTTVYCSRSYDGGHTWTCPVVLYTSDTGNYAGPLVADLAGYTGDAVMDENLVVHLVMTLGMWSSDPSMIDPRTDVIYGQIPYETCDLVNQTILHTRPLDATHSTTARPAICFGRQVPGGTGRYIHVVYGSDPVVGVDTGEIRYTRSSDGGLTWDFMPPVDINWFSGYDTANPPDICADDNAHVYVAYGPDWYSHDQPGAIYFRMSANDGVTWDSNQTVIPGTGGGPTVLCDNSNGVYLFYNFQPPSAGRTDACTAYRWSTNNGSSWSSLVSVAPRYHGGHTGGPEIPVVWADGSAFHVIVSDWISPSDPNYEAFYVKVHINGTILVPRTMLSLAPAEGNKWDWGRSLVAWPAGLLVGCCQRQVWDWGDVALGEPYSMALPYPSPVASASRESGATVRRLVDAE